MHLRPFVLAPLRELGYDIRPEGGVGVSVSE